MVTDDALIMDDRTAIDWAAFEDMLFGRFAVNAVVLTRAGNRKTTHPIHWANPLCALIKTHPQGAGRICTRLQLFLVHEAGVNRKVATDECAAGMIRMVFPILYKNALDGFVSVCGRPYISADRIYTVYIHETIDEDQETIQGLLSGLNPIDYRGIKAIKHVIANYAR